MIRLILCLVLMLTASLVLAQSDAPATPKGAEPENGVPEPAMTVPRLGDIIRIIDPDAVARGPTIEFTVQDIPVIVIADARADRMRAMVPIRAADGIGADELMRLMQANFDSALDARYAVAQGRLWGVFIHPLSPLERDQFLSGIAQTINLARTYGQTYSGGANVFGGGDSNRIYQDLLDDLRKDQEL